MIKKKEKEESKPILFRQDQSLFDPWGEGVKEFFWRGHDMILRKRRRGQSSLTKY